MKEIYEDIKRQFTYLYIIIGIFVLIGLNSADELSKLGFWEKFFIIITNVFLWLPAIISKFVIHTLETL